MGRLSILYDKDIQQRVFRLTDENEIPQKLETALDIQSYPQSIYDDGTVTLTGTLTDANDEGLSGKSIRILKNNVLLETVTTSGNGGYTKSITGLGVGVHYFRASFMGDEIYDNSSSNTIGVSVVSHNYALTISTNTQSIYPNESVTVSGKLTKDGSDYGSQTVEIYDGSSKVGEATTNSSGNYSTNISGLIVGTHTLKAKFNNTESSTIQVVVNPLVETEVSIDVPLVLVYGDDFNISGYLTTSTHQAISGKTVKLKVGSTVVDSMSTEVDGGYSFTQTPVTTGNHSFQVVFEGADEYEDSSSAIVSRTVGKETTVLTVTSPINNYSTDSTSVAFAGTLTDDDGVILNGKTVTISESGTTLATLTTDSNGAFGITLNNITVGSHQYTVKYEGDSNYTASTVNRTVTRTGHSYSLEVESDKDILSYADSESATVTATLRDNQVLVPNQELAYTIKHGSTTISSGSDTTDNDGQISFTYTSSGIGDVTVEVQFGTSLQETYGIEDCLKTYMGTFLDHYDDTSTKSLGYTLPSTWKIECDLLFTQSSNNSCFFRIGETDSKALLVGRVGSNANNYQVYARNGSDVITTGSAVSFSNDWQPTTMTFDGTSFKFNNDITVTNFNGVSLNKLLNVLSWKSHNYSGQVRNIKVKAL